MKVFLYIGKEILHYDMYLDYISQLKKQLPSGYEYLPEDSSLVDADVLHIISCWDNQAGKLALKARKMGIPYIVTPLGGISKWNLQKPFIKRSLQQFIYLRRMIAQAHAIIATTHQEYIFLMDKRWNLDIYRITNCVFTKIISPEAMTKQIADIYQKVDQQFREQRDKKIEKKINGKDNDHYVVSQILLIYLRMPHQNIPHFYIDKLQELLHDTEYSDDTVKELLEKLQLTEFAGRLFQVMNETTGLTEGFMPIPPLNDRRVKTIRKYIK